MQGASGLEGLIGSHASMQKVYQLIERVAVRDSTVLVTGESGTGKELVARAIHALSPRQARSLIPVNCGAIPEDLLESELFGHERGAFTGAMATRVGRFQLADGGTIFLDEIGDMSPSLQVKVLRVLQESEFERVGGTRTIKVNVRVVAATNQNLEEAVAKSRFREDLYYRLNVIPIALPPLRERVSDLPFLVEHILEKLSREKGGPGIHITPEAMRQLMAYHWPGNIRELENVLERVLILNDGEEITPENLPERFGEKQPPSHGPMLELDEDGIDLKAAVEAYEDNLILQALERTGWVKNKAAKLLNLNRTTLVEKLKKKGFVKH